MNEELGKALTSALTEALTPIVDAVVKIKTLEIQKEQAEAKEKESHTLKTDSEKLEKAVNEWVSYQTNPEHPLKGKDLFQDPGK